MLYLYQFQLVRLASRSYQGTTYGVHILLKSVQGSYYCSFRCYLPQLLAIVLLTLVIVYIFCMDEYQDPGSRDSVSSDVDKSAFQNSHKSEVRTVKQSIESAHIVRRRSRLRTNPWLYNQGQKWNFGHYKSHLLLPVNKDLGQWHQENPKLT